MLSKKYSVFQKAFWGLLVCVLFAGSVFAAISDSEFLELCGDGFLQQITDAIDGGANVNATLDSGVTPLIYAAAVNPNPGVVAALVAAGANVGAKDARGYTPLILASGNTALGPEAVTVLINAGADVNAQSYEVGLRADGGFTPLMAAAMLSFTPEVIVMLLNAGADINAKNMVGWNPILLAAGSGRASPEVIKALIDAGADVNGRVKEDRATPLILAAEKCSNPEVIALLLDAGANPAVKRVITIPREPEVIKTALDYARENENLKNSEVLKRLEEENERAIPVAERDNIFIRICRAGAFGQITEAINGGANINARAEEDLNTPLMLLADRLNLEEITTLINAGADVQLKNENGDTTLMFAAGNNTDPEVAKYLIEAGDDINAANDAGITALMLAAFNNPNPEVVALLLDMGADPRIKDKNNRTALDYARGSRGLKDTDTLKRLEEMSD